MLSRGRMGLALPAIALATAAGAANDSPLQGPFGPAVAPVRLDLPVETIAAEAPPTRGGWTRDGWGDAPAAPAAAAPPPAPGSVAAPGAAAGLPPAWRVLPEAEPPGGWRRRTWDGGRGEAYRYRRGGRLPGAFAAPRFAVADWEQFGLADPGPGRKWVRYYDDAVLVDEYGTVTDAVPAIGWDAATQGPAFAYDANAYAYAGRDQRWRDDAVTWDAAYGGQRSTREVYHNPDGSMTVVVRSPGFETTTVEETDAPPPARARRARRR